MLQQLQLQFSEPISGVSEIQLVYKTNVRTTDRLKINSSQDAYDILRNCYDDFTLELREEFKILLFNRANRVLGHLTISSGTTSSTVVDIKFIIVAACKANASGVILSHNHPSGNLEPSQADIRLTDRVKDALKLLDISLLDHIIVTTDGYTSLTDRGMI